MFFPYSGQEGSSNKHWLLNSHEEAVWECHCSFLLLSDINGILDELPQVKIATARVKYVKAFSEMECEEKQKACTEAAM